MDRLFWIKQLKSDPVHKKVMETRDGFINEDGLDREVRIGNR